MKSIGIDIGKRRCIVCTMDRNGTVLEETGYENTYAAATAFARKARREYGKCQAVCESTGNLWIKTYEAFEDRGIPIELANPMKVRAIAEASVKTDKADALILADMLRGGYIAECYASEGRTADERKLVRYRRILVKSRTREKNLIHGILLQMSVGPGAAPFASAWLAQVRKLGDYRIDSLLSSIERYDDLIRQTDVRLARMVKESPEAVLLKSIPGVGNYSALVISSMIGDVGKFNSPQNLILCAGLAPSVRSSADVARHGRITKRDDTLMRGILTECAPTHIQHAPNSYVTKAYIRIGRKRGNGKAVVAAAARMLHVAYLILKERREYHE